ncbi:unnamed protein product [Echinostoma caproni]|uniref:Uncharacterized protein n=1 Tax=Echinostoma caproni TaxID=27848 RepID=A0A183BAE2_9TREM|nr:unnamed protein product [Echinostoma caproni]
MSRAEQWRRRQLEEELSLSQYGVESMSPNMKSPSENKRNLRNRADRCPEFPSFSLEFRRRSSNLFANMISPERPVLQSPPKLALMTPVDTSLSSVAPPQSRHVTASPGDQPTLSNKTTPNRLGPIDQFVRSTEQRSTKCTPRNSITTPRNRPARAQFPASSPVESSREILVSPQIFDEEAMFLAREEFLNVTNTPNMDFDTPNSSSARRRNQMLNEDMLDYSNGCSPKRLVSSYHFGRNFVHIPSDLYLN